MPLNVPRIRAALAANDFPKLFIEELGWDRNATKLDIEVHGVPFHLVSPAQKRGFVVLVCHSAPGQRMPEYSTRRKIERIVAKTVHEHIIVFVDDARDIQVWQWVKRELGQTAACREHVYRKGQSGDTLIQKLERVAYALADEEQATLAGHVERVRDAFDVEKVTKRFYESFQKEHDKFEKFIKGLEDAADKDWYASVMLNRLMFVYFVQKKNFLDGDPDYLVNRLKKIQADKGRDKFHSFYRYFLLRLFHHGLGSRERTPELEKLLGKVPYLNGGIFDMHVLEEKYPKIVIPDEAFENLFAFFDQWEWHLDQRPNARGNEINPEVIGYIFEKYINQKQMGAYYTKEDITENIGKNCVIPFLFDAVRKTHKEAFEGANSVWRLLRDDPDNYIYDAVKKGCETPLPAEIAAGLDTSKPNVLERRKPWNKPAASEYALPTEIWREVVARRQRYEEIKRKLCAGEAANINDLITYNLDIRRFAEDAIGNCESPELLRAFWRAIEKVSVLDPTCGSGAFLFAALNILQPLYEKCLERMEWFVAQPGKTDYGDFIKILDQIEKHPNREYFVLKSIVVNNLYGVDIMEEAVEICKLRLFLKLAAQLQSVDQIEPLPDIDFNIRAGNTLIGFATLKDVNKTVAGRLADTEQLNEVAAIEEEARICDAAMQRFRESQTEMDPKSGLAAKVKKELHGYLDRLNDKLNRYLAAEYGVRAEKKDAFDKWLKSHQPFHWFSEFFGIMAAGGFDVIVGNPPWVEHAKARKEYILRGYVSESCGNLHGICTERGLRIRARAGRMSFIVQLPLVSSSRMASTRTILRNHSGRVFVIPFDDRPGRLFDGLEHCRSTIWFSVGREDQNSSQCIFTTTRYQRWPTAFRPFLFQLNEFTSPKGNFVFPDQFPKYANDRQSEIFEKLTQVAKIPIGSYTSE